MNKKQITISALIVGIWCLFVVTNKSQQQDIRRGGGSGSGGGFTNVTMVNTTQFQTNNNTLSIISGVITTNLSDQGTINAPAIIVGSLTATTNIITGSLTVTTNASVGVNLSIRYIYGNVSNYIEPATNNVTYLGSPTNGFKEVWFGGSTTNVGLIGGTVSGSLRMKGITTGSSNSFVVPGYWLDVNNYEQTRLTHQANGVGSVISSEALGVGTNGPINFIVGLSNQMSLTTNGILNIAKAFLVGSNALSVSTTFTIPNVVQGIQVKTTVANENLASFNSAETGSAKPIGLVIRSRGAAASSGRQTHIQSTELGLGNNDLLLNPDGGNIGVGVASGSVPSKLLHVNGTFQSTGIGSFTAGLGSSNVTASVSIATTGWTNTFGTSAVVYIDGVGVTATLYNSAGTAIYTNASTVANLHLTVQPSGKVIITAGTGVTGVATPF